MKVGFPLRKFALIEALEWLMDRPDDTFAISVLPLNSGDLDLIDPVGFPSLAIDALAFAWILEQLPSGSSVYLHTRQDLEEDEDAVIHDVSYYYGFPDPEGELPHIEWAMLERLALDSEERDDEKSEASEEHESPDLLAWWHSEFSEAEQEYILSKYQGPLEVFIDLENAEFDEEEKVYDLEIGWSHNETAKLDDIIRPNGPLGRIEYLSHLATRFRSPKKDLPLARRILAKAVKLGEGESGPILDRHFIYGSMIKVYYSDRERDEDTLWLAVDACQKQIMLSTEAADAFVTEYPRPPGLPEHLGYKQLAIICEKERSYGLAIDLSETALKQGWAGDWQKRIDRCNRR